MSVRSGWPKGSSQAAAAAPNHATKYSGTAAGTIVANNIQSVTLNRTINLYPLTNYTFGTKVSLKQDVYNLLGINVSLRLELSHRIYIWDCLAVYVNASGLRRFIWCSLYVYLILAIFAFLVVYVRMSRIDPSFWLNAAVL